MAQENVDEIRVAGTLKVYSADEDAGPPDPTDFPDVATYDDNNGLPAGYELLGFTSPDGSQFTDSKTTEKIMVHQRFRGVRTIVTASASHARAVELPGRVVPDANEVRHVIENTASSSSGTRERRSPAGNGEAKPADRVASERSVPDRFPGGWDRGWGRAVFLA